MPRFTMVDGVKRVMTVKEEQEYEDYLQKKQQDKQRPTPENIKRILENKFLELLPKHENESYLTPEVADKIIGAKLKISEAISLGNIKLVTKIFESLQSLPNEMQNDLASIRNLLPERIERR